MGQFKFGAFNLYKIRFSVDLLKTPEEKISYLYNVKIEINRVIQCFSRRKFLALRKYAADNLFIEDNCPELKEFLKKKLSYFNASVNETRFPGEEILRREIRKEVVEYRKLIRIIDAEINLYKEKREKTTMKKPENTTNVNDSVNKNKINSKNTELKMDEIKPKSEIRKESTEENVTSIRELKEKQKKIVWKGSQSELIYFFDQLYDMEFMNIKSYDEIFALITNFFVDKDGEPFRTDRVAEMKIRQRRNSLPKGYLRYMKAIEKLKSK